LTSVNLPRRGANRTNVVCRYFVTRRLSTNDAERRYLELRLRIFSMPNKVKGRIAPRIEIETLTETFREQLATGEAKDAIISEAALPSLLSPRGQSIAVDRCLWRRVTLADPKAQRLCVRDTVIESCDLANIDLTGSRLERVEITSTRLTGLTCTEAKLKSVLFRDCKMDFALVRMAKLENCIFENCNLTDADFYDADLSRNIFRECDLSRADISHAKLTGADIRDCRLDGIRGLPSNLDGLIISPDQAALLITLFGVRVQW
jgi:uncharacterized protein YjbI with pentapeptide repeats